MDTSSSASSTSVQGHTPGYFHVLAKPTGAVCNLNCTYCFFLSKEALYPESDFRMQDDLLEIYIRQLVESQPEQVTIAWQGGEPTLMGLEFFRRSVALVEKYRRPGQRVEHTIQTNGTRLDDAWCEFFKQHGFLVGLSVDGPRELHDRYRVDKGGKGTFDQVMRGWELLKKHEVECNILCTVHAGNAGARADALSVLPRHAGGGIYAVHSDCGAGERGPGSAGEPGLGSAGGRTCGHCIARRATG